MFPGITSLSRPSSSESRKSQESHISNHSKDSHASFLKRRVRNLLSKFSDRTAEFKTRINVPLSPQSIRSQATPQKIINDDDDVIVVETNSKYRWIWIH